jgi:hypothetical protein
MTDLCLQAALCVFDAMKVGTLREYLPCKIWPAIDPLVSFIIFIYIIMAYLEFLFIILGR